METLDCDFLVDDIGLNDDDTSSRDVASEILVEKYDDESLSEVMEHSSSSHSVSSDDNLSQARDLLTSKLRRRIRSVAKQRQKKRTQARELESKARQLLEECEALRLKERKLESRIERLDGLLDSDISETTHTTDSSPRIPLLNIPVTKHFEKPDSGQDPDFDFR